MISHADFDLLMGAIFLGWAIFLALLTLISIRTQRIRTGERKAESGNATED